jgi:hypothetical protein
MTLGANARIPSGIIEPFFERKDWDALMARRYEGYVILHATAREDRSMRLGKLLEEVPGAGRETLARDLCDGILVSSTSVGSHGSAQVEVYVIFYDYGRGLREALIFARQAESVAPTVTSSEMRYLGSKYY